MAKGIIDCTGKVINIGDIVKTEHGDVIKVEGAAVSKFKLFNAEKCKLMPAGTKLTNTGVVDAFKEGSKAIGDGDCVVWGL